MALKAGYKGIKKYIADKLNALGDLGELATDKEIAEATDKVRADIAPVLEEAKAPTGGIAADEQFYLNDILYTASVDIAAGANIVVTGEGKNADTSLGITAQLAEKVDNSLIAKVEDGEKPTKSYAAGEHMIRNNKFCTVTVPVTTESTWTLDSNYVEGDVASELDYEEHSYTFTFGGVTCNYSIKKVGQNISLYIYLANITITNGSHTMFTLPLEYRPLSYGRVFSGVGISAGDWATSAYYNCCIRVNPDGHVDLCGDNISGIKYVVFSAEYII